MGRGSDRADRRTDVSGDQTGRPDARGRDVDAGDGLHLHVVSSGNGPHVLLLHGFTGSAESWGSLRDALSDRLTVHAIDLPGHGASSTPRDPARYALDRLATDLTRVLDALGILRTAVLGYSLGGRAALRFALDHPDCVEALVLESASPGIADPVERGQRAATDIALAGLIEREGIEAFVDRWEQLPLWTSQAALPESTRRALRTRRLANRPDGLANSLRGAGAGMDAPVIDRLASIGAPTLLIAGALDAKYVALGRRMAEAIPQAQCASSRAPDMPCTSSSPTATRRSWGTSSGRCDSLLHGGVNEPQENA